MLIFALAFLVVLFIFSLPILWLLGVRVLEPDRGAAVPLSRDSIGVSKNLIAFASEASGNGDIYVFDTFTRSVQRVTTSSAREGFPQVDADSGTIVFSRFTTTGCHLIKCPITGAPERQLTTPGVGESDYAFRLAPGGNIVHFDRMSAYGLMTIPSDEWICDGDSTPRISPIRESSRTPILEAHPSLPFVALENRSRGSNESHVVSINIDGTTTKVCEGRIVDASTDGTRLLIEKHRDENYPSEWSVLEWDGGHGFKIVYDGTIQLRQYVADKVSLSSDGATVLLCEPDSGTLRLFNVNTGKVSNRLVEYAASILYADLYDDMLLLTARNSNGQQLICVFPDKLIPSDGIMVDIDTLRTSKVSLNDVKVYRRAPKR